ncbi:MAG: ArsC family transcriptional regulator [Ruminococcaceae bacterium]|nr:ArsC family transcriptional regulator [Oscillospiraceae bacterium]
MNIQIFSAKKCFDSKKAERWFKERRISFQKIDMDRYGLSLGEFKSVLSSVGLSALVDETSASYPLYKYLANDNARAEKLFEDQSLIKTPVVRNGKSATVGYCPDVWQSWK